MFVYVYLGVGRGGGARGVRTLRVARALELEVGGDAVDVRVELHAPLGALLLRAQLPLLVLPAGGGGVISQLYIINI